MTEKQLRQQFADTIIAYLGAKEGSAKHKEIIDIYNTYLPHPRGHKLTYKDDWCAGTVSTAAIINKLTDIVPVECSCNKQIELFKKLGRWQEADNYVPQAGDIMYYDWDDSGKGDNKGEVEHVGIVTECDGKDITVIEGNRYDSVCYRYMQVNGRYIRGYGLPDFASKATGKETSKVEAPGSKFDAVVQDWQEAAEDDGFEFPKYGADGVWGDECKAVAKRALIKKGCKYTNLNKFLQEQLYKKGYDMSSSRKKNGTFDGIIGDGSVKAIKKFQKNHQLEDDGKVGILTWTELLGY